LLRRAHFIKDRFAAPACHLPGCLATGETSSNYVNLFTH